MCASPLRKLDGRAGPTLSGEQQAALRHVTSARNLGLVIGYRDGEYGAVKRIKIDMRAMAKSLECGPQLELILAARKQQLGSDDLRADSIRRSLAMSIGFDLGRGRGWDLSCSVPHRAVWRHLTPNEHRLILSHEDQERDPQGVAAFYRG